jgi:hypothetical protein
VAPWLGFAADTPWVLGNNRLRPTAGSVLANAGHGRFLVPEPLKPRMHSKLYDRTSDEITLDEVERIAI